MRFYFFEYVFFASAFGVVVFFPVASPLFSTLANPTTALILALTGISAFAGLALYQRNLGTGLALYEKNRANRTRVRTFIAALVVGCVALFASIAGQVMPPTFVLWGVNAILTAFTFGSILARRFFRRVERDFRRNAAHIIVTGLATQAAALLFVYLFAAFPPVLIATGVAIIALVAFL